MYVSVPTWICIAIKRFSLFLHIFHSLKVGVCLNSLFLSPLFLPYINLTLLSLSCPSLFSCFFLLSLSHPPSHSVFSFCQFHHLAFYPLPTLLTLSSMFSVPRASLHLSLNASGFPSWCILPPGVSLVHRLNWFTGWLFPLSLRHHTP